MGCDLPPAAVDIDPKRPPNGDRRCSDCSAIVAVERLCVGGGKISSARKILVGQWKQRRTMTMSSFHDGARVYPISLGQG